MRDGQAVDAVQARGVECCADWKPQCDKINGYIVLDYVRSGVQYSGIPFRFCPWCGTKRPEEPVAVLPPSQPVISPAEERLKHFTQQELDDAAGELGDANEGRRP